MPTTTVNLSDLVPSVEAAVNPPGTTIIDGDEDDWVPVLANAFWVLRLKGMWPGYAATVDGTGIAPVDDALPALDRISLQLVVEVGALTALENYYLGTATTTKAKAGPVEADNSIPATVITTLLTARRAALLALQDLIIGNSPLTLTPRIVNLFAERAHNLCDAWAA